MSNDTDIVEAAYREGFLDAHEGSARFEAEREAEAYWNISDAKAALARQTDEPEAGLVGELAEAVHAWDTVDPNDPFAGMKKALKASRIAVVVEKNLDTILTALSRNHRDAVHCSHEAYQGQCCHCGVAIVNGRAEEPKP